MSRPLRIAFLDFGERWSTSIKIGLAENGHEVIAIRAFQLTCFDELIAALDQIKPDFCLSRNFYLINEGKADQATYRQFFENQKHRFVVWYHDSVEFNDPPYLLELWQSPPYPQNTFFFSVESQDRNFFSQRGLPFAHLPIAAGDHFFHLKEYSQFADLQQKFNCDLSFVGTQIFNFESPPANREEFALSIAQTYFESAELNVEENKSSDLFGLIDKFFISDFQSPKEFKAGLSNLIQTANQNISAATGKSLALDRWRINSFYSWMKLTNLLNDLQEFDIHVYGSDFWKNLLLGYERSTRSLGEEELGACYVASKINLNFTKYHFLTAIHERPFNILAAGGFPLTDYREDLENLFQEDEIASYGSEEELKEKIIFFKKNDSLREQMIEKGHNRVKSDHTYKHRLNRLVGQASDFFGF